MPLPLPGEPITPEPMQEFIKETIFEEAPLLKSLRKSSGVPAEVGLLASGRSCGCGVDMLVLGCESAAIQDIRHRMRDTTLNDSRQDGQKLKLVLGCAGCGRMEDLWCGSDAGWQLFQKLRSAVNQLEALAR